MLNNDYDIQTRVDAPTGKVQGYVPFLGAWINRIQAIKMADALGKDIKAATRRRNSKGYVQSLCAKRGLVLAVRDAIIAATPKPATEDMVPMDADGFCTCCGSPRGHF